MTGQIKVTAKCGFSEIGIRGYGVSIWMRIPSGGEEAVAGYSVSGVGDDVTVSRRELIEACEAVLASVRGSDDLILERAASDARAMHQEIKERIEDASRPFLCFACGQGYAVSPSIMVEISDKRYWRLQCELCERSVLIEC